MEEWFRIAGLVLKVSIVMQVFAVGLGATWEDTTYLFRRPRLLVNSILARNVAVPIIAILLIKAFPFHIAVAITLGILAVTPVPPLLPKSRLQAGARSEYALGLLVSQAILAVIVVPVTIELMDWALGARAHFSVARVGGLVIKTILTPLAVGMLASRFLPRLQRFAPQLLTVGTVLLVAGAIPLPALGWKAFPVLAGNGAMLAIVIFVVAGMAAGHLLGGPRGEDRTTLAIATAARHPGMALAIAEANYPDQSRLVSGAVVIYLILRLILSLWYAHWRLGKE